MNRSTRVLALLRDIMQRNPDAPWIAPSESDQRAALAAAHHLTKLFAGRKLEVRGE